MNRTLALFVIALVFGGGIGFVLAAANGVTFDGHDHGNPEHHGSADHQMAHDTPLDVTGDAPTVQIDLTTDPMAGYNLQVMTDNFTFAPRAVSAAHVAGQGHAHVYINGKKHSRLYGPWVHLAELPQGDVTVKVTLNSNDHRVLHTGGTEIAATKVLTID